MEPPELERRLGLGCYASQGPGIGGRLRVAPEDFVVEEIPEPAPASKTGGKYTIVTLRATNWETNKLVRELSRRLGVGRRGIFFTGTKDKRAVKTQQMAILAPEEQVKGLRIPGVDVLATYRSDRAPKIGDLIGNRFDIAVRQLAVDRAEAEGRCARIAEELTEAGGAPNYFGLQRFGSVRPITHVVGEHIVRGDVEAAVMAYLGGPEAAEPPEAFAARKRVQESRDFDKAVTYFPRQMTFERVLLQHLVEQPGDWTGALRKLPQNLVTMFIYAHQSLLFNQMLTRRLQQGLPLSRPVEGDIVVPLSREGLPDHDTLIPVRAGNLAKCDRQCAKGRAAPTAVVIGLDVQLAEGRMGEIERDVLAKSGIERLAYRIPHMPELASFGQRRAIVVRPGDFTMTHTDDAARFTFRLGKGSYATCVLREFMKTEALAY